MNEAAPPSPSEVPPTGGHERTDVSPSVVSVIALGLLMLLALVLFAVTGVSRWFDSAIARRESPLSPLLQEEIPPEPRLQADPAAELALWREEQEARRTSYEFAGEDREVVRIPVAQAIEILTRRGFPEPEGHPAPTQNQEPQP